MAAIDEHRSSSANSFTADSGRPIKVARTTARGLTAAAANAKKWLREAVIQMRWQPSNNGDLGLFIPEEVKPEPEPSVPRVPSL